MSKNISPTLEESKWKAEPSVGELLLLVVVGGAILDGMATILRGWRDVGSTSGITQRI